MDTLLLMLYHRLHHIGILPGSNQIQERMFRSVGIPQGEDGIIRKALRLVDVVVQATVFPIDIHIDRRINHRVIERGVEHGLLVFCPFDLEAIQFAVPVFPSRRSQFVEGSAGSLGAQVLQGTLGADG